MSLIARYNFGPDNDPYGWQAEVIENEYFTPKPYVELSWLSVVRPPIHDFPVLLPDNTILYRFPLVIPDYIKAKVEKVFALHPECKLDDLSYSSVTGKAQRSTILESI